MDMIVVTKERNTRNCVEAICYLIERTMYRPTALHPVYLQELTVFYFTHLKFHLVEIELIYNIYHNTRIVQCLYYVQCAFCLIQFHWTSVFSERKFDILGSRIMNMIRLLFICGFIFKITYRLFKKTTTCDESKYRERLVQNIHCRL